MSKFKGWIDGWMTIIRVFCGKYVIKKMHIIIFFTLLDCGSLGSLSTSLEELLCTHSWGTKLDWTFLFRPTMFLQSKHAKIFFFVSADRLGDVFVNFPKEEKI